jgi:hypothetical protein
VTEDTLGVSHARDGPHIQPYQAAEIMAKIQKLKGLNGKNRQGANG